MRFGDFLYILFLVIFGCKTSVPVREVAVRTETAVRERVLMVEIPADSAVLAALLECDSSNQVRLVEINELKSKRVESALSLSQTEETPHATSVRAALKYRVQIIHDTVRLAARDSVVYREIPLRVEVPVEVNVITGWQWFQIWSGRILLALAILWSMWLLRN
jgi:hypothetical protein